MQIILNTGTHTVSCIKNFHQACKLGLARVIVFVMGHMEHMDFEE